jgi:hypothetical protein
VQISTSLSSPPLSPHARNGLQVGTPSPNSRDEFSADNPCSRFWESFNSSFSCGARSRSETGQGKTRRARIQATETPCRRQEGSCLRHGRDARTPRNPSAIIASTSTRTASSTMTTHDPSMTMMDTYNHRRRTKMGDRTSNDGARRWRCE